MNAWITTTCTVTSVHTDSCKTASAKQTPEGYVRVLLYSIANQMSGCVCEKIGEGPANQASHNHNARSAQIRR